MKKAIITNAFSLNMIAVHPVLLETIELTAEEVRDFLINPSPDETTDEMRATRTMSASIINAVGHESTAAVFSNILNVDIKANRIVTYLNKGDMAIIGQYSGPRLPEGATELPEGAVIKWIGVKVK